VPELAKKGGIGYSSACSDLSPFALISFLVTILEHLQITCTGCIFK